MPSFARRFWPLWTLGVVGVLSLLLQPPHPALSRQLQQTGALSGEWLPLLALVNPLVLLTLMAAAGAALAHRVGLRSRLAGTASGGFPLQRAVMSGLVLAGLVVALDRLWLPYLGPEWTQVQALSDSVPPVARLAMGILYGGLAEEIMMRWGLMSLIAWALARLCQARSGNGGLSPLLAWSAVLVAALVFAAGHLPVLALTVELTPVVIGRTVVLNMLAGIAYGWLFWRQGLESAMIAHASTHCGFAILRMVI